MADLATRHPPVGASDVSRLRLVSGQFRYASRQFWRTPVAAFFTVALPLIFLMLVGLAAGNATVASGMRYAQFFTPGLLAFAVATATFTTPAVAVAVARERGVLKRLRGTPLPAWAYLSGRVTCALFTAAVSAAAMLAVAVLAFDVQVFARAAPALALSLVIGVVTFASLAFALVALLDRTAVVEAVSNGAVIVLAFVSDVFIVSDTMPAWLRTVGEVFPLKHFARSLGEAFDPLAVSSAPSWRHLAVMGAWAIGASLVAVLRFSWEPRHRTVSSVPVNAVPSLPAIAQPLHVVDTGRPSAAALLGGQIRYANRALWRDAGSVFFSVAFPILLLLIVPAVFGTGQMPWADSMRFPQWYAPALAVYGIAVHAFVNVPEGVARARDTGVLKRLRGTALPARMYVAGRIGSIMLVAALILTATMATGVLRYRVDVPVTHLPAALLTLALGTLALAALGLMVAAVVPNSASVPAVTLAFLLPLSFVSDIFMLGELPRAMTAVGWIFPLKHFVHAMVAAFDPTAGAGGLSVVHLGVLAVWGAAGAIVATLTFRWEPSAGGPGRRRGQTDTRPRHHRRTGPAAT